jgi:type IV pilus assembly protein PilM
MLFKKKQHLVGLDLGSHTVKLMQMQEGKGADRLLNFGLAPLPDGAFSEGKLREPELVASTIKKLAKHLKIKDKTVAISISGYEVMIKKIELPVMTEEELGSKMREQLGQYIPYSIDEVNVDYQILSAIKDRPKSMEVLLVAAKKDSIADYVDLVRIAGFDPVVIDVDCFALSNAHEACYGVNGNESVALVDIGANKASIYVINKGMPVFTRDISIGGFQITDAIRSRFRLPHDEAERIKLGGVSEKIPVTDLGEIFISITQNWVSEVKRVIDFYYNNYPGDSIKRILLSGGSSKIPGLDQLFKSRIAVEIEIFNPLNRLEYDDQVFDASYINYIGSQMAVCLGLALRKENEQ